VRAPKLRCLLQWRAVETNDSAVLPSVHVWQDHANTVIVGTLISPGTFARI